MENSRDKQYEVKLIKFYPFPLSFRRPRLLGFADVELENILVIRGVKLFEAKNGGYFVQLPEPTVEIKDKKLLESIRRVVVDKYKEVRF
ncbi:hypothetical protein Thal_1016 [Thermocrinis albus DSM 14484]|uniref:Stage V sporulation protein G n=1 Tax=Thermocrinis albus (strain DSM 14484 / JCM 11386 / HI 11/12) TaxID=638303 RepID=D3SLL8_THEAH|nr:hypothetical protein Thal_1016 [Thermocrinis albus DSM 14484]